LHPTSLFDQTVCVFLLRHYWQQAKPTQNKVVMPDSSICQRHKLLSLLRG